MALIRSLLLAALFACTAWAGVSVHTNDVLALDPAAHPITLQAGAEHRYTITATQSGTPIDLTGLTGLWTVTDPRDAAALITWTGTLVNASAGVIRFIATPPDTMEQGVTYEGHTRAYLGTSLVSLIAHDYLTIAGPACSTCSPITIIGGAGSATTNVIGPNVSANSPGYFAENGNDITGSTVTVGSAIMTGLGTTNVAVDGVRLVREGEVTGGGGAAGYFATSAVPVTALTAGAGDTVTVTVAHGPRLVFHATNAVNLFTINNSGWPSNAVGIFTLDAYVGTNSWKWDTTAISNTATVVFNTTPGVATPLVLRRRHGATWWEARN